MSDYCNALKNIKSGLLNQIPDKSEFNIKQFLITNSKTIYIGKQFNFDVFLSSIKLYLHNDLKLSTEQIHREDGIIQINFHAKDSIADKLNVSDKYTLLILKEDLFLKSEVVLLDFLEKGEEKSKFNPANLLHNSYRKKIYEFALNKVFAEFNKINPKESEKNENVFIETASVNEKILSKQLVNNEKILFNLHFKSIKNRGKKDKLNELSSGFILINENHIFLILLDNNDDIIDCKEAENVILLNKNILKKSLIIDNYIVFPKRQHSNLFAKVPDIQAKSGNERIRITAELNYFDKNFNGAAGLLKELISSENNSYNNFLLLLCDYKKNRQSLQDFISENVLSETINTILNQDNEIQFLNTFSDKFKISLKDKLIFLNLFSELANNPAAQEKVIAFYNTIRPEFFKKNKNKINRIVFDIGYAEFLIKCKKNGKAKRILKKLLKHLPDETVTALLPPDDLDLTGNYSGQFLRVTISDLITKANGRENSGKEIKKSIVLQPLNKNRIELLATVSESRNRAEEALEILTGKALFSEIDPACNTNFRPLADSDIRTRLVFKTNAKKNTFYNLQKWISKVKEDDYSSVKKYTEKITSETHNTLFAVLKNTSEILNLPDTEFYITKGERKNDIIGYSGKPPFILIGSEFTDRNSNRYMNLSELRFSTASELTHIYFKHTKLTSKDVWRGLIDKGAVFADAALAVIPAAGVISKTIQNVPKLNLLSRIFKAAATGVSTGKTAYDAALKISDFYGKVKSNSKTEKKQSLLAASRIMQYTADNVGLLICGNLTSAVRVIFLSGKFGKTVFEEIKQNSLEDFLLKQNNDGTYKHQETALRIANLFSFYFSEDFSILRKKIETGE